MSDETQALDRVDPDQEVTSVRKPAISKRALVAGGLVLVVVLGVVAWRVLEDGPEKVPYVDPASSGLITLCSADGKPVTEGKVTDHPFAAFALGDTGLPAGLEASAQSATLFAYQPRETITPAEFSGSIVSAATPYADRNEPVAQLGEDTWSVGDFAEAFPANLDGYIQLRLVSSTPDAAVLSNEYDTADIRITGDTWHVVTGGNADCSTAADRLASN